MSQVQPPTQRRPMALWKPEMDRIERVIEATGRGLLFAQTRVRMVDPAVWWRSGAAFNSERPMPREQAERLAALSEFTDAVPAHGENPDVAVWWVLPKHRVVHLILYNEWEFFIVDREQPKRARP